MISVAICITIINNIGAKLSPCLTPHPTLILAFSFPIFRVTVKLEYNLFDQVYQFDGCPKFVKADLNDPMIDQLMF